MKIIDFGKIKNHNTDRMCTQRTCSQKEEYFYEFQIGAETYYLVLCEKHYEAFNEKTEEGL